MNKALNELIDIFQLLNEKALIFDKSELQEERENLTELAHINDALWILISELIQYDEQNRDKTMEQMMLIRMKVIDIIWNYEQIYNLTTKFIQKY